jgi:hypothetical protein
MLLRFVCSVILPCGVMFIGCLGDVMFLCCLCCVALPGGLVCVMFIGCLSDILDLLLYIVFYFIIIM